MCVGTAPSGFVFWVYALRTIPLTIEEEYALSEALWKAAEGIRGSVEVPLLAHVGAFYSKR